jgi:DNA-binding PucR family transcriptional regulator
VRAELGPLATGEPASSRLRAALLAVIAPHGGVAAAARELGVHRNTVLQRVRRAEELRGRPVTERAGELYAALLLAEALPEAVLSPN